MTDTTKNRIIKKIAESIDIPDSAYDKAEARYKDLGEWFGRKEARCQDYDPHIYPQGSFRLGTVISPVDDDGEYDLDMGCRLRVGVTKSNCTQQQLKHLVGADLEEYRAARGIRQNKEEKHRCWRLKYADSLKFHLDAVPSIPETLERRRRIQELIFRSGAPSDLAMSVANLTGAITDNRMWNYRTIDNGWLVSNSEGFALWFESRMAQAKALMKSIEVLARAAKVDKLPAYRWKSPLQRCVQILKRHRDIMFAGDPDGKPASVIITTLSAMAYEGEAEIADALEKVLSRMEDLVNPTAPRIPNPVNPDEDFADRWRLEPACESNFWWWLRQARLDFDAIGRERRPEMIVRAAMDKLGASISVKEVSALIGVGSTGGLLKSAAVPNGVSFPDRPLVPKKPAGFA